MPGLGRMEASAEPDAGVWNVGPSDRRLLRLGVGGALLLYVALAILQVFAVAPFVSADESAHVDYALQVAHGHLPVSGTKQHAPLLPNQPQTGQYVSNHPPLYHAIVGVMFRLGIAAHDPDASFYAARLVTASFTLVTIVLVAALALMLGGKRRVLLAVAGATTVALFSPLTFAAATIQNDSLAAMFATAALVAAVRIVLLGSNGRRLAALCVCCALGALTRATMVPIVAMIAVGMMIAAEMRDDGRSRSERTRDGLGQGALVVLSTLAVSGWFYALNISRYGDPIGASAAYSNVFGRASEPSSGSLVSYVTDIRSWTHLWRQAFGGLPSRNQASSTSSLVLAGVAGALVIAGVLAIGLAFARDRRRRPAHEQWPPARLLLGLARVLVAGSLVICLAEIAFHATNGGAPHGRYLAPGIAAFALGVPAALLALKIPPRGLTALVVVLGALAWAVGAFVVIILRRGSWVAGATWFGLFTRSLDHNGVPAAPVVFLGLFLLAVAGLVAVGVALWRASGSRSAAPHQPADQVGTAGAYSTS